MTGYLTPDTDVSNIAKAAQLPWFAGWKLYPQGVTTGSEAGVADISELKKVLSVIEHVNSNLLIHGEKIGADPLIAEEAFVKDELLAIRQMFAGKIVLEHCSTKAAIRAVFMDENMWGTLTPHHLTGHHSETDNPHNRCKPAWQPEDNQKDFLDTISCLAKIGQKKFFAGSDTAPQLESQKLSAEVPNGCFAAPVALQLYAQAFSHPPIANQETLRDLYNHLSAFLFENAADFYNVPKQDWAISPQTTNRDFAVIRDFPKHAVVKDTLDFYDPNREIRDRIIPLRHGERLEFSADFIHK
jgi:dihydroorotase